MDSRSLEKTNPFRNSKLKNNLSPQTLSKVRRKSYEDDSSSSSDSSEDDFRHEPKSKKSTSSLNSVTASIKKYPTKVQPKQLKLTELPQHLTSAPSLKNTSSTGIKIKFESITLSDETSNLTCKSASLSEKAKVKSICTTDGKEEVEMVSSKSKVTKPSMPQEKKNVPPRKAQSKCPEPSSIITEKQIDSSTSLKKSGSNISLEKSRTKVHIQHIPSCEKLKGKSSSERIVPGKPKPKPFLQKEPCVSVEAIKPKRPRQKIGGNKAQVHPSESAKSLPRGGIEPCVPLKNAKRLASIDAKPSPFEMSKSISEELYASSKDNKTCPKATLLDEKVPHRPFRVIEEEPCSSENISKFPPIVKKHPCEIFDNIENKPKDMPNIISSKVVIPPTSTEGVVNQVMASTESSYYYSCEYVSVTESSSDKDPCTSSTNVENITKENFSKKPIKDSIDLSRKTIQKQIPTVCSEQDAKVDIAFSPMPKTPKSHRICVPLVDRSKEAATNLNQPCPYFISDGFEDRPLDKRLSREVHPKPTSSFYTLECCEDPCAESRHDKIISEKRMKPYDFDKCTIQHDLYCVGSEEEQSRKHLAKPRYSLQSALGLVSPYDDIPSSIYSEMNFETDADFMKPSKRPKEKEKAIRAHFERRRSRESPSFELEEENERKRPVVKVFLSKDQDYRQRSSECYLNESKRDKYAMKRMHAKRKVDDDDRYRRRRMSYETKYCASESSSSSDDQIQPCRYEMKSDYPSSVKHRYKTERARDIPSCMEPKPEHRPCHKKMMFSELDKSADQKPETSREQKRICSMNRDIHHKGTCEHVCDGFRIPSTFDDSSRASIHEKGSKSVVFKDEIEEYPSRTGSDSTKLKSFMSKIKHAFGKKKSETCIGDKQPPQSIMKVKLNIDMDKYNPTICIDSSNMTEEQKKEAAMILSECSKCFSKLKRLASTESFTNTINEASSNENVSRESSLYSLDCTVIKGDEKYPSHYNTPIKPTSEKKFHAQMLSSSSNIEYNSSNSNCRCVLEDIIDVIEK